MDYFIHRDIKIYSPSQELKLFWFSLCRIGYMLVGDLIVSWRFPGDPFWLVSMPASSLSNFTCVCVCVFACLCVCR